jgi:hypothetical protein
VRFGQPERRDETLAPASPLRLPSVAVTRVGAYLVTGSAVAVAVEVVAAVVQKQGPSFRDAVVELGSVMLFGAVVALGAALLARVAGAPGNGLAGVSVILLVVGVAIVGCQVFAFVNVLWMHQDVRSMVRSLEPLQRHTLAALAIACVFVGLALLSLLVASGEVDDADEGDADEEAPHLEAV